MSVRATETAEVVIVGGGAVGASTAHHLAQRGITDVVLLERSVLGAGSTSKAAGGVRLQFADELNVRIMLRSVSAFERFPDALGADIGFHQVGYLILIDTPQRLGAFERAVAMQRRLGVPVEMLSPADAKELVPQLSLDGVVGATFCPRDGHATPEAVVQGYAAAAAARGVRIQQGRPATAVRLSGDRITAVETPRGAIATSCVICTAGVASRTVAGWLGLDLPVHGEPHWLHYSPVDCGLPARLPLTVDFGSGFYVHREGPGLVVGGRERAIEDLAAFATRRIPGLATMRVQASWWGDYDMSPDCNAIIGESPAVSRFLYATGFSGHGFQQCPAVGEHLAELAAGEDPSLDLAPLALERFAGARARAEELVI